MCRTARSPASAARSDGRGRSPAAKLNKRITASGSAGEILDTCSEHLLEFDAISTVTALYRAARISRGAKVADDTRMAMLLRATFASVSEFGARGLANAAWRMAKPCSQGEHTWSSAFTCWTKRVWQFQPQAVSNTAQAATTPAPQEHQP